MTIFAHFRTPPPKKIFKKFKKLKNESMTLKNPARSLVSAFFVEPTLKQDRIPSLWFYNCSYVAYPPNVIRSFLIWSNFHNACLNMEPQVVDWSEHNMWLQWSPSLGVLPVNVSVHGWVTLSTAPSLIIPRASLSLPSSICPPSLFLPASNLNDRQRCQEQSSHNGRLLRSHAESAEHTLKALLALSSSPALPR